MNTLRMPWAHSTTKEIEVCRAMKIAVQKEELGGDAMAMSALVITAKIDGNDAKLAMLLGVHPSDYKVFLMAALRKIKDPQFNSAFHRIRSKSKY